MFLNEQSCKNTFAPLFLPVNNLANLYLIRITFILKQIPGQGSYNFIPIIHTYTYLAATFAAVFAALPN